LTLKVFLCEFRPKLIDGNGFQFAANLSGHFASTSELGMFGTPGGEYSAYGQQFGYGPQYTQWPDGSGRGGYSYLGVQVSIFVGP
jgi:hypothetical protein